MKIGKSDSLANLPADGQVRHRLVERFRTLAISPTSQPLLVAVGMDHVLASNLATIRLTDIARAVHLLEYAADPADGQLVVPPFMTRDDVRRNRGFDGVELEMLREEAWLVRTIAEVQE